MKINIENLILFIIIIFTILYCIDIKQENFNVSSDVPNYYSIDTEPISVDKYVSDLANILDNTKRKLNNELFIEKLEGYVSNAIDRPYFNTAALPINRESVKIEKIMPIIDLLINTTNKLANKNYSIKFVSASNIIKEETEFEIKLQFIIKVDLFNDKSVKIKDLNINSEILIRRELPDDIFNNPNKIEQYYVVELGILGLNTDLSGLSNKNYRSFKQPYDDADFGSIVKNSKFDKNDLETLVKQFI